MGLTQAVCSLIRRRGGSSNGHNSPGNNCWQKWWITDYLAGLNVSSLSAVAATNWKRTENRKWNSEWGSDSLKSCIFTCKDFLTSVSFPLNPKTSPLHGSNPGQWRCFCAAGTVGKCLNLAKAECLLAASLEKTSCPCCFSNADI